MTDADRAREVLAAILEPQHPLTAKYTRDGLDDPLLPIGEAIAAMLAFATLQVAQPPDVRERVEAARILRALSSGDT